MGTNELVSVLVPAAHLTKVYELIVRLEAGETAQAPAREGESTSGQVTRELIERMYRESEPAHRKLMKYLASRPGDWVGTDEIASDLGLSYGRKSLAGSLGAFGRRADHRYGGLKPWGSRWNDGAERSELRMGEEVAAWIEETAS